jgi:voltage-gated potassium channel
MSNDPSKDPSESGPNGRQRPGMVADVTAAVVALPAAILTPFIVVWRALHRLWSDKSSRGVIVAAAWLLVAGTVIFMIIEDLSFVDGFYFSFVTLATIGYGDIAPATDMGKMVTVIYGIAGLGIMAALISSIAALRLSPKWQHGRREDGSDREADQSV